MTGDVSVCAVHHVPEVRPGDDLGAMLARALKKSGLAPAPGDVLVVKSKVVSKAEGRLVDRDSVTPSPFAVGAAALVGRSAEFVEMALRESERVVRMAPGVLICRTKNGFVLANAGVDASNTGGKNTFLLLPENPDASARRIRAALADAFGCAPAVLITDTFGRAWRKGQTDVAIGAAGMAPLRDYTKGSADADGNPLAHTRMAVADELAGAADLVCGKDRNIPAALVQGYALDADESDEGAQALLYPEENDLFL